MSYPSLKPLFTYWQSTGNLMMQRTQETAAMQFAAAETIIYRLLMMQGVMTGGVAANHPEFQNMVHEKMMAGAQGMQAATLLAGELWLKQLGIAPGWKLTQHWLETQDKLTQAALRPARLKVSANAKRLRRKK